jgi:6-phosphogluconolactonase (cycloisomerase 2 family)
VYTVSAQRDAGVNNNIVTWRDINAKSVMQEDNPTLTKLIFDGQSTVFTTDCRDVYAWSVSDESEQLLIEASAGSTANNPIVSVSVDRQHNVLYVGRFDGGVISVFNLTYT